MRGNSIFQKKLSTVGFFIILITLISVLQVPIIDADNQPVINSKEDIQLQNAGDRIPENVDGDVLVKFRKGISFTEANRAANSMSLIVKKYFPAISRIQGNVYMRLKSRTRSTTEILQELKRHPDISDVSLNDRLSIDSLPNDAQFYSLWGLHNTGQTGGTPDIDVNAPEAWDMNTGSSNVIVAIIDSGIDYNHPDLAANIWANPNEVLDGIDNDGNGYIDDIHGINAITSSGDPMDDNSHGTHCAGTIGAIGNNSIGVAGVNWNVKMIGTKFVDAGGSGLTSDAIICLDYIIDLKTSYGQNIVAVNASFGGASFNQIFKDAIDAAGVAGIIFCASAGNDGTDNDVTPHYPSSYSSSNIIAVTAVDDDGNQWYNYGATSVDLGAPGVSILSTVPCEYFPQPGDIFYDDMELGATLWVHGGTLDSWNITNEAAGGLESYWWDMSYGNFWSDSPGTGYVHNIDNWLATANDIDLSSYIGQTVFLGFDGGFQFDYFVTYDTAALEISNDSGATWSSLADLTTLYYGYGYFYLYQQYIIPDSYKTENFRFRFHITSDDTDYNYYGYKNKGWIIDNIGIGNSLTCGYGYKNGTSMATPHVTGAVALMAAQYPSESALERKTRILNYVTPLSSLTGLCVTGGMLNLYASLGGTESITITSPNGGESWAIGSDENITWTALGLSANLKITLWKDDVLLGTIADEVDHTTGFYPWTVGQYAGGTAPAGSGYTVKIKEIGTAVSDVSDASFTLFTLTPSVTVTSPNGGENWALVSPQQITWNAVALSANLKITLWKDGLLIGTIADDIDPTPGAYLWSVGQYIGGTTTAGSGYTIKIKEIGSTVSDVSDAPFTISLPSPKSWTFMVYLDGDNNLEEAGIDDFMEMSSVGSTSEVNIVVQFDRINGYDSSYDDWTGTKRFYITTGMTPTPANAIMDLGEANMGDPATLVDFVNWTKASFPATNYALIVWNHGDGWRDKLKEVLWRERQEEKKEPFIFKSVCWDDTNSGDCLYMNEVQSALNSSGGASLIGFDACLMSMVEVAYEIRNHGQVMVGSEETVPWGGWPYDWILSDLTGSPSMTPSQLGSAIVNEYYWSYGGSETQSAVDLTHMTTLANTVSTFAQTMINSWETDKTAVRNAADNVITEINNTIIDEQHGNLWPGAHGLAIYFPETSGSFDPNYNGTIIDFPNNTQWEEFLQEFYSSMGGSWIAEKRAASQQFDVTSHIDLYNFCQLLSIIPEDYYTETQVTHEYLAGGTAQNFWADDSYITYPLPFDFPFFGETISTGTNIYISSNGYVDLSPDSSHWDYINSTSELAGNKRIAPCWIDLITYGSAQAGEDVYITENPDNLVIRWVAETFSYGDPVNVELVLFQDGRIKFNYNSGNTNLTNWNGPPTIGISKGDSINYYLSVYDGQSTLTNVDSDLFTPLAPSITIIAPNGGENWPLGSTQNITWDCNLVSANIKITLWKDGGLVGTIANDIDPALGSYSWTVGQYEGGTASTGTGYAIKIKEIGTDASDMSDAYFTITDTGITVTSPNGGEDWQLGSVNNITWTSTGLSANIKITLWKDGGLVGTIADDINPALGSYSWTAGEYVGGTAPAGTGYAVKIKEIGSTVTDMSDGTFNLTGITITSPNGGENWQLGTIHNITWNCTGLSANVKITLWKDGGLVGTISNEYNPALGSYSWTVGQYEGGTAPAGTGYAIKIKEIGTTVSDMSDATFAITN